MVTLTSPKVHMGTITGGEARELYATNPVILLPMGSQEDQGPHAVMGDYLAAEKVAELAALRATANGTRTVVAPVLPFGGLDHFGPMIGGIALTEPVLMGVVRDMVACLHRNNLTRIIFINGHGGNVNAIHRVGREVFQRTGMIMPSLYLWRICFAMMPSLLGAELNAKVAGHGADPLTSMGLHLYPEYTRPDLTPDAKPLQRNKQLDIPYQTLGTGLFDGAEIGLPNEYDEIYNQGVARGDPRLSSAETGAMLTEKLVDLIARFAAHFVAKTAG